ncbi:MAG: heavy metal translocating P-type ATPase, partial [Coprobacillaceae bacterium]
MISILKDEERRTVLFLVISFISLIISFFQLGNLPIDIAWIAIVLCGVPIIIGALQALISEFDIKADVLVSLALMASIIIGEIFAAGEIAFIMTLGAYLEDRTVSKARAGIEKLVELTPTTARIIRNGIEKVISAKEVQLGDILRVLAGETIAVDGIVIEGKTSINQAIMTGESLPVDKSIGDEVFSGTVNQFGTFEMKATKVGENSSIQRMIKLVESANANKAKIVGMADKWATWIVVIALISAIGTYIVTNEIIRSVTILVVFCPCALVLATPTAIMAGIGNATKYGILIKEGDALERLAKVKYIAFDKTGTLTYGVPKVTAILTTSNYTKEELLYITTIAELRSEHPLGKAIVAHYNICNQLEIDKQPESFKLIASRGVQAIVEGNKVLAGNNAFLMENEVTALEDIKELAQTNINEGSTIIYISINQVAVGCIALSDIIRDEAKSMVDKLHNSDVKTILLTGDNEYSAKTIAENAGIEYVKHNCLPEDKLDTINSYEAKEDHIC